MSFADKFGLGQEKSIGLFLQSLIVIIAIICSLYFSISAYGYSMLNFIAELIGLIACIILLVYSFGSKNKNYFVLSDDKKIKIDGKRASGKRYKGIFK